jgi:hypothetical protein
VIVESNYRGYRIEVNAVAAGGVWNAQVRIRRILSEDKPSCCDRDLPQGNGERGGGTRCDLRAALD